ncbi:MAG: SH3 domain-containing protein [Anaerolineae bacterium]|nr:SH3 domain-containing protein [Anaerolineae bacterium]
MPVQAVRMRQGNQFEEAVFAQISHDLGKYREQYSILSPFKLKEQREYDGIIISPYAVFTLEMKQIRGTVQKGPNTPLIIYGEDGREVNLRNRFEDPIFQADMQWRTLSDYFSKTFSASIFVKAVLVFPDGTKMDVPPENRDFTNHRVNVLFATVSEVARLVQRFRPPYRHSLSKQAQEIIARALRDGEYTLSGGEIELLSRVISGKRPSHHATPQPNPQSNHKQEPDRQRPFNQSSGETTPIATDPLPDPPRPLSEKLAWMKLPLSFALVYILLSLVASTTTALIGATIFTFFIWAERRKMAFFTVVVFVLGTFLVNSINFSEWLNLLTSTTTSLIESPNPDQPALENNTNVQLKEGADQSDSATLPATPRLRVISNSNVRADSSTESSVIGMAEANAVFVILDQTADNSWYKIRLASGAEGWVGSTRVKLLDP